MTKEKKGKGIESNRGGKGDSDILSVSLITFKPGTRGCKGVSHVGICIKIIQGTGNCMCKGTAVGVRLVCWARKKEQLEWRK